MSAEKAFHQWNSTDQCEGHEDGCRNETSMVPIDECFCSCYRKHIFKAGYRAAKGIAKESSDGNS